MLILIFWAYIITYVRPTHRICHLEPANRSFIGTLRVSLITDINNCRQECLGVSLDQCSSVIYIPGRNLCLLITGEEERNEFTDGTTKYFRRICRQRVRVQSTLLHKTCFEEFPGKVLLGAVDKLYKRMSQMQCQKICSISLLQDNIVCKAAIYYSKEEECIISSESRFDLPELFIDDKAAIYMENRCAEKFRNKSSNSEGNKEATLQSIPEGNIFLQDFLKI
ncbi:unnamed protein product [Thelazia callipaeda]|uniref:Apple domain-containing protein n=1 Tax=Thelazia callipaeda TaxID=103827 RepID=A0A0N5D3M6_THECL|nr:unnamed protein product [Thelazia callipaeda]